MIKATIITIGDELLIGQVIDTNSAYIAQQLNIAGFAVNRRIAVGDNAGDIKKALDEEKLYSQIILITGGLGPTADDITKPLLCQYFGGKMVVNDEAFANVQNIVANILKRPFTDRNKKQAQVPDVCTVIQNKRGTAPGMIFFENVEGTKTIFVSMPGVPYEMMGMMQQDVIPLLKSTFSTAAIAHRTLVLAGVGESTIADMLINFESQLPDNIKLAYLPSYGMLRLRLTATHANAVTNTQMIEEQFEQLQNLVSAYLVSLTDEPIETTVANLLIKNTATLSTAESCTGGYIAHLFTSIAGSSAFFEGSIISYANDVKQNLLGVQHQTLLNNGAVSKAVVLQMAAGALQNLQSTYTIAVSGIMGPSGGTKDKPVGTVWICVGNTQKLVAEQFYFRFDRALNIKLTAAAAINMLRKFILEIN